jgi:gyrA: DNA gyrase, A subunit
VADENNTGDEQFTPDGSMEPLSPQEADTTDYGLMDTGERIQRKDLQQEMRESYLAYALSVIVERALPDVRDWYEARASPRDLRDVRRRLPPRSRLQQVLPRGRRRDG